MKFLIAIPLMGLAAAFIAIGALSAGAAVAVIIA